MIAADRTLPPFALGAGAGRCLVGDALVDVAFDAGLDTAAAVVLDLDLPKRRLTWAS